MKKVILSVVFVFILNTLNAQNTSDKNHDALFNKWSLEFAYGLNKPETPLTYSNTFLQTNTIELGVRYMLNTKFGLKFDAGYNGITGNDNKNPYDSKFYRTNIQAVINLGRVLNFETWTKRVGLLAHTGFGVARLEDVNSNKVDPVMINFIFGATAQVKVNDKFVITGDLSSIRNKNQSYGFDFANINTERGFSGSMYTVTLGVSYYLGKNTKHADWYIDEQIKSDDKAKESETELSELENKLVNLEVKLANLESKIVTIETKLTTDTDKDGVPDYLDEESVTSPGDAVDVKGKSFDRNKNGIPDNTEAYVLKNYANPNDKSPILKNNEIVKSLINEGYVGFYFDFDKSTPSNLNNEGSNFILAYLRKNPKASLDIIGNADDIGNPEYNKQLSKERALYAKAFLVKAGIKESRLNVIAAGSTPAQEDSAGARQLIRNVTFKIK